MSETLEAIFEEGKFKPLGNGSLPFSEGQHVKLIVEAPEATEANPVELARQVYDDLTSKEIDEIETIALDRGHFFHDHQP